MMFLPPYPRTRPEEASPDTMCATSLGFELAGIIAAFIIMGILFGFGS